MVESSALLKRRTPKGYRGFESLPHRHSIFDFRLPIFDFAQAQLANAEALGEGGFDLVVHPVSYLPKPIRRAGVGSGVGSSVASGAGVGFGVGLGVERFVSFDSFFFFGFWVAPSFVTITRR